MKLKKSYVLYTILIICFIIISIQDYNKQREIVRLETTIAEQSKTIENLKNENALDRKNCSKIVKGYAMTLYDVSGILRNLDKYYNNPNQMILEAGVIMSRAERFMERKNKLLEEMDIDVDALRLEINEMIKMKKN